MSYYLTEPMFLHQHFLYALSHITAFTFFSVSLYHTTSYHMFFVIIDTFPSFFLIIHWHFLFKPSKVHLKMISLATEKFMKCQIHSPFQMEFSKRENNFLSTFCIRARHAQDSELSKRLGLHLCL